MAAYSIDLRERVLKDWDRRGLKADDVAEKYSVSRAWVHRLVQRRRETGEIGPAEANALPAAGAGGARRSASVPRRRAARSDAGRVTGGVADDREPRHRLAHVRTPRLELQKKRSTPPNNVGLTSWPRGAGGTSGSRSGRPSSMSSSMNVAVTTDLLRRYGRSPSLGERVRYYTPVWPLGDPHRPSRRYGVYGYGAPPRSFDGPIDTASFLAYVEQILVPTLRPGEVVVFDNLAVHKQPAVRAGDRSVGAQLRFLPPYSPDFNPIELAFAKLKGFIPAASPRDL